MFKIPYSARKCEKCEEMSSQEILFPLQKRRKQWDAVPLQASMVAMVVLTNEWTRWPGCIRSAVTSVSHWTVSDVSLRTSLLKSRKQAKTHMVLSILL